MSIHGDFSRIYSVMKEDYIHDYNEMLDRLNDEKESKEKIQQIIEYIEKLDFAKKLIMN